jgi:HK97 family phage major capsid protein
MTWEMEADNRGVNDVLVYVGDAVKALDDNGRVGGYLVRYGTPDDVDLTGDYFDASSDFDVDEWPHKSRIYYQHGLDSRLKHRKLGNGEMRQDEIGVWVEAQLTLRDEYEKAIFELVKQGKMGWSSGTAGHLVEREEKGAAMHITHWPLGLDASITPTPAEYRNSAVTLKSLSATDPRYAFFLPETGSKPVVQEAKAEEDAPDTEPISQENPPMDEEETTSAVVEDAEIDMSALVKGIVTEQLAPLNKWLEAQPVKSADIQLPMINSKNKLGDDETKAHLAYILRNDDGGIKHLKASSNNPMSEGTTSAGGYAVPTGMYQQIIAKLREDALYPKIGVRLIPGKGKDVNVPIEGARDGAFVLTAEGSSTDRDAPVLGQATMTLAKYTKRIEISWELIEDEDAQLFSFLATFVGQGMAKTHNTLLITEALAGGTLGTAWGNPIVATNVPSLVYALPQGYEQSAVWIMKKSVEGTIRGFSGNNFQFVPTAPDGPNALSRRELWGFPLYNSDAMPTAAASAKAAIFGNFNYMGMRMAPDITYVNDPYSGAITGQLRQHYWFRTVYKTLQAEAIIYGQQGT